MHHGKNGHTDIIEMEEFDGQYDKINVHFVRPYPAVGSDQDDSLRVLCPPLLWGQCMSLSSAKER